MTGGSLTPSRGGDRLAGEPFASRSTVWGAHGAAATAHPLATLIAIDLLRAGGSAVDAAIGANAVLGFVEPINCGIGGDAFAMVWDPSSGKLAGLNGSGRSPRALTLEIQRERARNGFIAPAGAVTVSTPGAVDAWWTLHQRYGRLPWADLFAPATELAEQGAPVAQTVAHYLEASVRGFARPGRGIEEVENLRAIWAPEGRTPAEGEVFANPALARTYRLIAAGGRDAFYRGPIAEELVKLSDRVGGLFAAKDFADHTSTWVEPVGTTYRGVEVWELPPNGQGIAALQMLNILEGYDLAKLGAGSADYWHLFLEAKKLAFADRARYYADPDFAKVPVAGLVAKPYAAERRKLIHMDKALTDVEPGDPKLGRSDTTYLCAVDKDRNCVSLIQSNYTGFGSGVASAELGFALQNRGCLFALDPKHPNALEPHKRPFHTIIPALVTKGGAPWFVFGVMGGDMQPQGHVEVLCNLLDFGLDVQAAGEAPRLEHVGSATPTGRPAAADGGMVKAEPGVPEAVVEELRRRGHTVERVRVNGGGYQGILIDPATGVLHGGSEARKDGCAVGY